MAARRERKERRSPKPRISGVLQGRATVEGARHPIGLNISVNATADQMTSTAMDNAQQLADETGTEYVVRDVTGTGGEIGRVMPRRSTRASVSMSSVPAKDYERIFKHTKYKGDEKKQ